MTTITFKGAGSTPFQESSNLGSSRECQVEAPGYEMGRSGRAFFAGITLVAGGVVPVVDLPTTTGPCVLYNANPSGASNKVLVPKRITAFYASGTGGAAGFGLFCGITSGPLATALVANGATNFRTQGSRGSGTSNAFIDVAKTIPAGTCWMHLGGIVTLANTVTGPAYSVDVTALGLVVPSTFALVVGVLGDTGTTAKFGFSIAYDELEAILP